MLNSQQRAAVDYAASPLLVLAGAGCGKTRVITEKIAHLVRHHGIDPSKIFAITFTNKAAKEMRERVATLVNEPEQLQVSTFHALGLLILQTDIRHTPYQYGFSILDSSETHKILQELLPAGIKKDTVYQLQWQISTWKNAGLMPADIEDGPPLLRDTYLHYQKYMQDINALDFDDMILQPLQLLTKHQEVLLRWQGRVGYMLVDEYQDTNASQYKLLKLLVGKQGNLTCVGDDDQSIYGWRGAQPENLQLLSQDFPGLKVINLEQNYRSSKNILAAAHGLIEHNPHPFEKKIWSDLGQGDLIRVNDFDTAEQEAMQIAADIEYKRMSLKLNYGDFAVLYRSNHQARIFEQVFRSQQVPYHLSGGRSFFDFAEIRDLMAYLRLLVNPQDNSAVLRIINTPKRGIGGQTVQQLATLAQQLKISLLSACGQAAVVKQLPKTVQQKVSDFHNMIHQHQHMKASPDHVFKSLLTAMDYLSWVSATANQKQNKHNKTKLVKDFLKWIDALCVKHADSLPDLLNTLALQNSQEDEQPDEVVRLMTLHAAKGLEFPHVYLVGLEEGILPHRNSLDEEETDDQESHQVQEERRLLYVGITRAMRGLHLSYVKRRPQRFQTDEILINGPSRFLDEIPQQYLSGYGPEEEKPETEKTSTKDHLATLRAMLENQT
ncbi:ATP-dependent helicase [Marinicella sp. W31]|uniref:ATP-dependent helicase n=1 Tax=Marinicella sp. W31 TaxID=3023713 RepID=UPI0037578DA7